MAPQVNAVDFELNGPYLAKTSPLSGVVSGKSGIISGWMLQRDNSSNYFLSMYDNDETQYVLDHFQSGSVIRIDLYDSAGDLQANIDFDAQAPIDLDDGFWHHYIIAWDLAQPIANSKCYVDGVKAAQSSTTFNDATINYNLSDDIFIGATWIFDFLVLAPIMNCCLAEFYVAFNQWVDLDAPGVVEKWRQTDGSPSPLGAGASLPTGTAANIYMKSNAASYLTNSGTGGDFDSIIGGALVDCITTPPTLFLPTITTRDGGAEPPVGGSPQSWAVRGSALDGVADSNVGTISFWYNLNNFGDPSSITLAAWSNSLGYRIYRYRYAESDGIDFIDFYSTVSNTIPSALGNDFNQVISDEQTAGVIRYATGFSSTIDNSLGFTGQFASGLEWDGSNLVGLQSISNPVNSNVYIRFIGFSLTIDDSFSELHQFVGGDWAPGIPTGVAWDGSNLITTAVGKAWRHVGFSGTLESSFLYAAGHDNVSDISWIRDAKTTNDLLYADGHLGTDKSYRTQGFTSTIRASLFNPLSRIYGISWFETDDIERVVLAGTAIADSGDENRLMVTITSSEEIKLTVRNSGKDIFTLLSNTLTPNPGAGGLDTDWHHVLIAYDTSVGVAKGSIWIDDVDETFSGGTISNNDTIQYSQITRWSYSAAAWDNTGNQITPPNNLSFVDGIAQLYANFKEYVEPSVAENRRKFSREFYYVPLGKDFGGTGSGPTGTVPNIYFNASNESFLINNGDGGDFSLGTGAAAFDSYPVIKLAYDESITNPLVVSKLFSVASALTGSYVTLTITLDNTSNVGDVTGVAFTDTLPPGLVVNTPSIVSNDAGGVLTAAEGSNTVSLVNGVVAGGATATITVGVTSNIPDTYENSLSVTSSAGESDVANDTLIFTQDKVSVSPEEHLTFRPDPRVYIDAERRSPKSGRPLVSQLDIFRGLSEDDEEYYHGYNR